MAVDDELNLRNCVTDEFEGRSDVVVGKEFTAVEINGIFDWLFSLISGSDAVTFDAKKSTVDWLTVAATACEDVVDEIVDTVNRFSETDVKDMEDISNVGLLVTKSTEEMEDLDVKEDTSNSEKQKHH